MDGWQLVFLITSSQALSLFIYAQETVYFNVTKKRSKEYEINKEPFCLVFYPLEEYCIGYSWHLLVLGEKKEVFLALEIDKQLDFFNKIVS